MSPHSQQHGQHQHLHSQPSSEQLPAAAQSQTPGQRISIWAVRLAFAAVFIINVQCALQFVIWPDAYAPGFELAGLPGQVAVRGLGVAFLMWNATYPAVIAFPLRFKPLAFVVLIQQLIGFVGEVAILFSLPAGHDALVLSIGRFALFDGVGLLLMFATFMWLLVSHRP